MSISKTKSDRYKVLQEFYKDYQKNGYSLIDAESEEFKKATGLNENEIKVAMAYLRENLLDVGESGTVGRITNPGIDEYESTIENPEEGTENFPANIFNIINSTLTNSPIQQGNIRSTQNVEININNLKEIRELVDKLQIIYSENVRENLNKDEQNILDENIKEAKEELEKDKPLTERIKQKIKVLVSTIEIVGNTYIIVKQELVPLAVLLWDRVMNL